MDERETSLPYMLMPAVNLLALGMLVYLSEKGLTLQAVLEKVF